MPDEPGGPPDAEEAAADARLLRRTRWRLVAWSAITTAVVLLLLGTALYAAAADSLSSSGIAGLRDRAAQLADFVRRDRHGSGRRPPIGPHFEGGGGLGTFAFIIDLEHVEGPDGLELPEGLPDEGGVEAARRSGTDVRAVVVQGVPFRVLSTAVTAADGSPIVIQAVQDRTAEQQTLDVLLIVLLFGGVAALGAALSVGAIYAQRALVPIRTSLAAQHLALRRQREFAADASHELRTPLTIVRGSVEHLRRHPELPVREVGTALDDIQAEVDRVTALVDDLLLLARADSGALDMAQDVVDLGDVAADAAVAVGTVAGDREVRLAVDPEPTMVTGDRARLRQLVTILLDNAVRHSPPEGTVALRVRVDGETAALVVEDGGPGIREEDLPFVFDRFWRASDSPGGGTGLGLAIAASIVARHGGRITAGNRTAGGARLAVTLPLHRDHGPGAVEASRLRRLEDSPASQADPAHG